MACSCKTKCNITYCRFNQIVIHPSSSRNHEELQQKAKPRSCARQKITCSLVLMLRPLEDREKHAWHDQHCVGSHQKHLGEETRKRPTRGERRFHDGKRDRPGGISLHPVTPGSTRSHIGCAWHESTSHEGLGDCCEEVGWAAKRLRRGCEDLLGVGGSSRDAEGTT